MKFTISRQELLDAVNKVKTVVSPKSALPILSHILFEAKDNQLKLTATDLKVSIECTVDCAVEEDGQMTVSSARAAAIISELPEQELTMHLGENNIITLTSGKISTKLFSMSPEEFPPVRDFEGIEPLVLQQNVLKRLFQKTSFAICTDQARYNLTGLLLEMKDGTLVAVATDGRRMSLYKQEEGIPSGVEIKVIVPGKMINELERLLGEDEEVRVYFDESAAAFAFNSIRLVTSLIDGTFPNYDIVVPKKHDKEILVDTARFTEAVRRTRTMTNEKFNSVRFHVQSGTMVLRVFTPEVGEYEEEMPVEYDGEDVEIAFNPDFVLDVLRRIDSERADLMVKDAMSPGMLRPYEEQASDNYQNVIMPIRI